MRVPRIEVEGLIIGYAMSRLDATYLLARGTPTWTVAYHQAAESLGLPTATFKNLRDEFDPCFDNARKGWHGREIRPERQRVLVEFEAVSDVALLELVARILSRDAEAVAPAVESVSEPSKRVANVADRLLTGRLAEEYFITHHRNILEMPEAVLDDLRIAARGYDFGVVGHPHLAVEVKGLRKSSGGLLFTDREWTEATSRRESFWLVVVGDLDSTPRHGLLKDPVANLDARCVYETRLTATWRSQYRMF